MTPFFQASRHSLAYQFTITASLLCPPFSNFRKFFHFQPCFGQNFSSQDANFPNFRSLDPSFSRKIRSLDPILETRVAHTHQKKSWVPPPRDCIHLVIWWSANGVKLALVTSILKGYSLILYKNMCLRGMGGISLISWGRRYDTGLPKPFNMSWWNINFLWPLFAILQVEIAFWSSNNVDSSAVASQ